MSEGVDEGVPVSEQIHAIGAIRVIFFLLLKLPLPLTPIRVPRSAHYRTIISFHTPFSRTSDARKETGRRSGVPLDVTNS